MYRLNALFTKYSKSVPLVASIPAIIAGNDWYEYIRHNNTTKSHTNSSFKPSLTLRSVRLSDTLVADHMSKVYERSLPSVVKIWNDSGYGTGFVVDKSGLIVTNAHVVGDWEYVGVKLSAQRNVSELYYAYGKRGATSQSVETLMGHVIYCDAHFDLAVVRVYVTSGAIPALPLASYGVLAGEPLLAIGNPGVPFAHSFGFALGPDQLDHLLVKPVLAHCAHTGSGMSGGPVVDREGKVIGVTYWGNREDSKAELAINANKTLTKAVVFEAKYNGQRFLMGDKRSLGVMLKQTKDGFVVKGLGIDSAEGLAVDDVIVEINGKPLKAFRQLEKAMQSLDKDQPLKLTVHRANDPVSVTPLSGLNHNCSRF